jgi:ribonuclease D
VPKLPSKILPLIVEQVDLVRIVQEVRESGIFALDLEFVTEGFYSPKLALVQIAWGQITKPQIALIDPLQVDVTEIVTLVANANICTVIHASQADLQILGDQFGVRAKNLIDTQIAAAFAGFQDQVGYGNLVEQITGVLLNKASQFSDWTRRPLSEKQLLYAANDVEYLLECWNHLESKLRQTGRIEYVLLECDSFAELWSSRPPVDLSYLKVDKAKSLRPSEMGVLRNVAAWRETKARENNVPRIRILSDRTLIEISREMPENIEGMTAIRGLTSGQIKNFGHTLIEEIALGRADPIKPADKKGTRKINSTSLSSVINAIIQKEAKAAGIASRFIATRSEIDELVHWFLSSTAISDEPDLRILRSWRRELVGNSVLEWLSGKKTIIATRDNEAGFRLS